MLITLKFRVLTVFEIRGRKPTTDFEKDILIFLLSFIYLNFFLQFITLLIAKLSKIVNREIERCGFDIRRIYFILTSAFSFVLLKLIFGLLEILFLIFVASAKAVFLCVYSELFIGLGDEK